MGYRRKSRLFSRPGLFVALMIGSVASFYWPGDILGVLRNFTQFLAPPQLAAHQSNRLIAEQFTGPDEDALSPEQFENLAQRNVGLENAVVSQAQQIRQLQATIDQLTLIRKHGFPSTGVLIPARVIARDASALRESLVVGKGKTQNAEAGDWVISSLVVDAGRTDGVNDDTAVLSQEYLIGWVEKPLPLTSRVVLLSDRLANHPIRVNIVGGDKPHRAVLSGRHPMAFVLEGAGRGRMRIPDIPADLVESNAIKVGDLILSDATNPWLPLAMMVGEIESLDRTRDRNKPLFYDATVRQPLNPGTLTQVFIVDLSRAAGRGQR